MVAKASYLAYFLLTALIIMSNCKATFGKNIGKAAAEKASLAGNLTPGSVDKSNGTAKAASEYDANGDTEDALLNRDLSFRKKSLGESDDDALAPAPVPAVVSADVAAEEPAAGAAGAADAGGAGDAGASSAVYIKSEMAHLIVLLYVIKTVCKSVLTTIF